MVRVKRTPIKPGILALIIISIVLVCGVNVSRAQVPGMYVTNRYLFSSSGDTVILKGFNAMIVYWDIHGEVNFPEIEKTKANCVRIFWKLAYPTPQPSDLDKVLENCIANHMIPIICLWDATGEWSKIQQCVDYWCSTEIIPVIQKYEKHLIVNIANEPGNTSMGQQVFRSTYSAAVQQMRTAGIRTPIIIDADNWGRNADAVLDNGEYILEQDPEHNLIFSWHLWDPQNWGTGTTAEIDRIITKATGKNICFIVGEFGPCEQCGNCSGTKINWEYLIEKAYKNDIGYLPWVWKWSDCHSIVNNSTGAYGSWVNSPWGESVAVTSLYSIKKTAQRPSDLAIGIEDILSGKDIITAKPNPFSQEVEFIVSMECSSRIELGIFDLMGRLVARIEDTPAPEGQVILKWTPDNKDSSGTPALYLYKLKIQNCTGILYRTGKIIRL
jgi:hypothetical protein